MSAESGLKTFRDSGGLWENHSVFEVATPEAWKRNPELVLRFYNERRKQLLDAKANAGHYALVDLEKKYNVHIITQNVDDLHERAGSKNILHLHGELKKVRSTKDENLIYTLEGWEVKLGDKCELGSQLRPHIVWFGESVPAMEEAYEITSTADILLVVGTSLNVYPAASLIDIPPKGTTKYLIDPGDFGHTSLHGVKHIKDSAALGLPKLVKELL